MQIDRVRRGARLIGLALAALAIAAPAAWAAPPERTDKVPVQLLGINDFHGNLEPPGGSGGRIQETTAPTTVNAGGAAYLATRLRALRAQTPNTLTVSAGDLIGASPLLSALFHDEPTIEAMNQMGLDYNAVGNHEFDEGVTELLRMQNGGCGPTDSCPDGRFDGAEFGFLAANVAYRDSGEPIFPPYAIRKFGNIKVGFIGMTLEGTANIVSPSGIRDVQFLDEAETANRYATELRRQHGVRAIVVLLHEGGTPTPFAGIDACNVSGPIVDIVERTSDAVDLFVTGHTHQPYTCTQANGSLIDGRPVTSAASNGRLVTDIDFDLDRQTKDIENVRADNTIVTRETAALDIQALIDRYRTLAAPRANRVIGHITADINRDAAPSGEHAAGNLIADAQLAASDDAGNGQAVAALMNPGGVRASFLYSQPGQQDGDVTYGEAFEVQPFGNNLTTITLNGAQLHEVLRRQWCADAASDGVKILQPSATFSYSYSRAVATQATSPCATAPNPVVPGSLTIAGTTVANDASQSFRITVNSFLADGGDFFPTFTEGTDRLGGIVDTQALEEYIAPSLTGPAIAPPALNRITVVD